jgi:hypothetical protein
MFNLDVAAASTSDSISNRINASGIYTGVITRAEWSKSQTSQAEFFNIDFKDDEGKEANYMSICFKKGDGTNSFGYNIMNKIMACTGQRSLNKVVVGDKTTCPELTNARIKFALQAEQDWYKDKTTGEYKPTTNMIISIPFSSQTGQSAKEVLESAPAVAITTTVVKDRKPKDKPMADMNAPQSFGTPPPNHQPPQMAPAQAQYSAPTTDFDDDIPF